jgi:hypothetical protein
MGGPGSGNHYHWWRSGKKSVVEDCLSLDANRWTREGILRQRAHCRGSWRWTYQSGRSCSIVYEVATFDPARPVVRLSYTLTHGATGQQESLDYDVDLTTTRPRFGGLRWWFVCPLIVNGEHCERRAGKLYLPPGARNFGCLRCHRLTYTSCQESRKYDSAFRWLARDTGYDFATVKRAMNSIGRRRL